MHHSTSAHDLTATPACGVELIAGDVLVPYDEVIAPTGRYIDCGDCHDQLAADAGGSSARPAPPKQP